MQVARPDIISIGDNAGVIDPMKWACVAVFGLLAGCSSLPWSAEEPDFVSTLDTIMPRLIDENSVAGVGIAVIEDGDVIWEGYYGEQGPGISVTRDTAFNTGSVAKTVASETMLSLAARNLIDLDEPIAPYVQHPSLSTDERYALLTPRLLLSHRGGLLNWAYLYEDGVLAFDHDPGTRTSYSGAGIELVVQYAVAKTGRSYSELAKEAVFDPLGIERIAMGVTPPWTEGHMSMPMDNEGNYREITDINPGIGTWAAESGADDLIVTVPAYAKIIQSLTGGSKTLDGDPKERETLIATLENDGIYACEPSDWLTCPDSYGHAVGWHVFQWGDHKLVKHTGSDGGEVAFVYASPDQNHGAVIFVNGANGWPVMMRVIEAIGQEPLIADYYRGLFQKIGTDLAPLDEWMAED